MAIIAAELADDPSMVEAYRTHEYATRIIRELEMARVRLGMTQRDLADKMGVSLAEVANFEDKPDEDLELGFFSRYATALGLRVSLTLGDGTQSEANRTFILADKRQTPDKQA